MPCSARLKQAIRSYTAPMQAILVISRRRRASFSGSRAGRLACPPGGRMKRRILFAMVLFGFAVCASAQKVTAVRFQKLWDGERVIDGALVLIENGRSQRDGRKPVTAGGSGDHR